MFFTRMLASTKEKGQFPDLWSMFFNNLLHSYALHHTELFHNPLEDFLMFKQKHLLKRTGESLKSPRTVGQVGTGKVVIAEKQLTLINSVGKAIHRGYAGSECHLLPGPTSFIKLSHKAWTHLNTYLHTNAVINPLSALAQVASCSPAANISLTVCLRGLKMGWNNDLVLTLSNWLQPLCSSCVVYGFLRCVLPCSWEINQGLLSSLVDGGIDWRNAFPSCLT